MDIGYTLKQENPRSKANILSKLFFIWMVKLCRKGTQKSLEIADLYKTLTCDQSEQLTDRLEKHWNEEVAKAKAKVDTGPSLLRAIVKTFFWKYMGFGFLLFFQLMVFRSLQPLVLSYFIRLFSNSKDPETDNMYIFGSILVLQSFFSILFVHHIEYGQASVGMRIRIAVSSLIYRKMLKLNKKSLGETAAGRVVNLLSNDVNRFDMVLIALHYLWITPFVVVLITYFIWLEVGISSLAGVLSMVLLTLPLQGYLGKLTSKFRLAIARRTDHRVKLMNEVIQGIQVIKMYAWEKPFEHIIRLARKDEIDAVTKASYLRGIFMSCMVFIERTTLFLTVTCYSLLDYRNHVTADKVFSMAQFFNILQFVMAIAYPMAITFGAETLTSIKRLREFMILEEKPQTFIQKTQDKSIILNNISASWTPSTETIKNFDLHIPQGTLCAIVGPVGAGKSSILQLVLGELALTKGSIVVGGSISYSSQEPWLFASTVRNNILFGQEYQEFRYRQIVKVCALKKDFTQFPQGDKTIVGERGVSLSGGQRARINLARAIYRQADIYLLDDPLSAVDTHVGKHLFEECIVRHLRGKTRILVTHQIQYLKNADLIVVVNDGRIEAKGTFDELISSNLEFTKYLLAADETEEKKEEEDRIAFRRQSSVMSRNSTKSELEEYEALEENAEEMSSSDSSPFRDYVKASGNCCTITGLILVLVLSQLACSGADYWITFWTQQEETLLKSYEILQEVQYYNGCIWYELKEMHTNNTVYLDSCFAHYFYIYVYTGLIAACILLTLARSFGFFKMAMVASKNLHNKMFHSLLEAPMRFFDTNPSGRVLNRFSKDMGAIDELLPRVLMDAIQILLVMTGILVMVSIANYYMLIAIVVIGAFFLKVRAWYIATAKDVKHLEGITKSPVFSHLNSSLNGITTIRACGAEAVLSKEFDSHQDVHTAAWFLTISTRICFGLWLDLISVFFIAVVVFGFIVLVQFDQVDGSFVGLAISQSLILSGMLQFGMRQTAEVINQLTSVERVMQYTRLENEKKPNNSLINPRSSKESVKNNSTQTKEITYPWPSKGLVEFRQVSLRYSETDPPVLKDLNFLIQPGEKIGIVGRTGAGKSSLISALFRLAPIEGHILIDGVDTKSVELNYLRKHISIIPQEPVLFSATLRYNLDPFGEFDDEKIWQVLSEVELKDAATSLDFMVTEGGSNFSLGQRQLICLARAILRNNKVLVLDEATANVDLRTDSLIQGTIRRKFGDCTVLTIAHRLNTIMDSDKILVMDSGMMVEFDHPHLLLQDSNGHFTKMVEQTGPAMVQQLRLLASDAYEGESQDTRL